MASGSLAGLCGSEEMPSCELGKLDVRCTSSMPAESLGPPRSLEPSREDPTSFVFIVLTMFEGSREVAGRYIKEGFVAGGGIERLARPMFAPEVPGSANLLFLFVTVVV